MEAGRAIRPLIVALDTNILVYVEGVNAGDGRQQAAISLIESLTQTPAVIPVQVLGELYNVLVRKAAWSNERARRAVMAWRDAFALVPTTEPVMLAALDLATDHHLGIWDSVIVAAATEGGARLLLSEDLQDGFTWRGLTVVNPFTPVRHPLLQAALTEPGSERQP